MVASTAAETIYLDHHATTPIAPEVLEAMLPFLREEFGNAASTNHAYGHRAKDAVDRAQAQLANLLGCASNEIVWTSGATESDNLALKGVLHHRGHERRNKLITLPTEHKAVIDSAKRLAREGCEVVMLSVNAEGLVDLDELADALDDKTALVSVMLTNNEIGTVQNLAEISKRAHEHGAWLHVDAAQGLGYLPFDVEQSDVDLLSCTAHKLYGPKGIGALYVRRRRRRISLVAEIDGGGHQRGMRSGTLPVPGIVAFGAAADLMARHGPGEAKRLEQLRSKLWQELQSVEGVVLNGPELGASRHPGNLNVSFAGVHGPTLMARLQQHIAVSSGAACSSASVEPSYVLRAIGCSPERATSSVRFGLGHSNTEAHVDLAASVVRDAVLSLREAE